jgi:hypothetical protein
VLADPRRARRDKPLKKRKVLASAVLLVGSFIGSGLGRDHQLSPTCFAIAGEWIKAGMSNNNQPARAPYKQVRSKNGRFICTPFLLVVVKKQPSKRYRKTTTMTKWIVRAAAAASKDLNCSGPEQQRHILLSSKQFWIWAGRKMDSSIPPLFFSSFQCHKSILHVVARTWATAQTRQPPPTRQTTCCGHARLMPLPRTPPPTTPTTLKETKTGPSIMAQQNGHDCTANLFY